MHVDIYGEITSLEMDLNTQPNPLIFMCIFGRLDACFILDFQFSNPLVDRSVGQARWFIIIGTFLNPSATAIDHQFAHQISEHQTRDYAYLEMKIHSTMMGCS